MVCVSSREGSGLRSLPRAQYETHIALMAPPADIANVRERAIDGPNGPLRIRNPIRKAA
jgi:hypothetical protein